MNSSTLTFNSSSIKTSRTSIAARLPRMIGCKWDLLAVLSLIASSTVYGLYALTQMTGF